MDFIFLNEIVEQFLYSQAEVRSIAHVLTSLKILLAPLFQGLRTIIDFDIWFNFDV